MTTISAPSHRMIFVNLPVKDLARTKEFFAALGFSYRAQFTDDKAACMIINERAYAMLLSEAFFATFTSKHICDTKTACEGIFALSCSSRAEVDELVHKAIAAGGSHAKEPIDHGFMYGWSFFDLDGHHWEVMWMDPAAVQ